MRERPPPPAPQPNPHLTSPHLISSRCCQVALGPPSSRSSSFPLSWPGEGAPRGPPPPPSTPLHPAPNPLRIPLLPGGTGTLLLPALPSPGDDVRRPRRSRSWSPLPCCQGGTLLLLLPHPTQHPTHGRGPAPPAGGRTRAGRGRPSGRRACVGIHSAARPRDVRRPRPGGPGPGGASAQFRHGRSARSSPD